MTDDQHIAMWDRELRDHFVRITFHYLQMLHRGGHHIADWYEAIVAYHHFERQPVR